METVSIFETASFTNMEGVATKQISSQFRILMQMRIIGNQFVYNYEFNKNNMYQSSSVNSLDFDLHTTKHIKCR